MMLYEFLKDAFFLAVLVCAGFQDFRCGKVPNGAVFPSILLAGMFAFVDHGFVGVFTSVANGAALAAPLFILYRLNAMGAGDVKIMFAAGMWWGFERGALFMFYACLFGVFAGVVEMVARRELFSTLKHWFLMAFSLAPSGKGKRPVMIPFAGAMAFAGAYVVMVRWMGW